MSRSRRANPVKVVIINTEYIQTDAISFKSVVQRLTGKDSPSPSSSSSPEKLSHGGAAGGGGGSSPVLTKGLSFRDLDKLLLELPSMDDIYQFCAD